MSAPTHAITNKSVLTGIHERMEYARLPWHVRLFRRPPPGWRGTGWSAPLVDGEAVAEQRQVVAQILAVGVEADPRDDLCVGCGHTRHAHWLTGINHCPGGDPDDTFTEQET